MTLWKFISQNLSNNTPTTLLWVIDSKGSSPGRKGFLMAVNKEGIFEGTIGGGIMEVKMISLAIAKMEKGDVQVLVKKQYHDKEHARNQSGLICSGEQTVLVLPLDATYIDFVTQISESNTPLFLHIRPATLNIKTNAVTEDLQINSETDFDIVLQIKPPKVVHIFGAGHVGLALAQQLSILGYYVIQYDDRPDIPSLPNNTYAAEIKIIDYSNVRDIMISHSTDIVVIVSFSYRSDKLILQQLYKQPYAYIGMMGSDHKIATLRAELAIEGITDEELKHVSMPIGLNIFAKRAEEIAVSIAGEIILRENEGLPTGRSYGT